MKHFWRTASEGLVAGLTALFFVFILHVVAEPFYLDQDMQARVMNARAGELTSQGKVLDCTARLSRLDDRLSLISQERDRQQDLLNNQQTQVNFQQDTINSCVVSLGKMNPVISTRILVLTRDVGNTGAIHYFIVVVTINRTAEARGELHCSQPFLVSGKPDLLTNAGFDAEAMIAPMRIDKRTYELEVSKVGAIWGPNNPITLIASAPYATLGECTFKQQ